MTSLRASSAVALTEPHPRRRLIIAVAVGYAAAWAVGLTYGLLVKLSGTWEKGASWERVALVWFHGLELPPLLDGLMLAVPYAGTNLTILPLMFVVGFVLWRRYKRADLAIHLLTVSIGSLSLNPSMKYLLGRPRPDLYPLRGLWNWASYPSGHLILVPALYFTVSLMLLRGYGWRWPFAVTALIIVVTGFSRLYLQVHWPSDLVGGLLIGFTWLFTSWQAFHQHHLATRPGALVVD
jgi:undecaprenyl-diphosphatase